MEQEHAADGPLAGVTVLEVGVFMAGPFATMQLADLGARVIKVENPAGPDPTRSTGPFLDGPGSQRHSSPFLRLNRNKESVALDLKSDAGRAAFLRLVAGADVLVENLRPGALRRLGLGPDELAQLNPGLVYASASGFGQDGPLAALPGLDIMAQARAGLMSITGSPDGDPVKVGVPICDLVSGLYTALAVTAALLHRDQPHGDGRGQQVDVSLLESGVSLAVWEAGTYFATGQVGRPLGSAHQTQAPYQAVRCADGWVTVGAITPKTWDGLCAALDLPHLHADPRYADSSGRHAHRTELIAAIEHATTARDTAGVVAALEAAGVPCAPINDYGQVFTDAHLAERDFFWDAEHPDLGPVRQLGSPMRLSGTAARRGGAGPVLGADSRAVLGEVGYSDAEIDALLGTMAR
ncbi:CaiB/BaiF CoA transferase family protein [Pseudonocardia xinjiangensis]|uniref:CoA transferase n=1 Tax=Pseudonocardia xinjiangensis TaxID=75289 RepID=A0ABX1RKF5_9PSEU|nr:CoA transferase [Pseudonocardia xinjiangensis]NMH80833.1 CoA transferase [Pseudonocardia xinjiangensis]